MENYVCFKEHQSAELLLLVHDVCTSLKANFFQRKSAHQRKNLDRPCHKAAETV